MARGNLTKIKAILLDLDNTLYEYKPCDLASRKALFGFLSKYFGVSKDKVQKTYSLSRKEINSSLKETGSAHSKFLYIQRCIEKLSGNIKIETTLKAHKIFQDAYFSRMKLSKGVEDFLKLAKKKNIKICVVSDLVTNIQMQKIKHLKITKYIDFLVTSEEAGFEKPRKEIFDLAFKKLGVKRSETILIGDDYEKDILGAKRLGIKSIHFAKGKTKNSLKAKNFKEISKILFS